MFQVVSVCSDVLLRDLVSVSFPWITAANEWSLVYVAFLGAGWLERESGHTRDDSMLAFLGRFGKPLSDWLTLGLGIVICVFLIWYGTTVTWDKYVTNAYDFFKLQGVPVFWVYLVIPFGSLLWLIQLLRQLVRHVRTGRAEPAAKSEV
jgi:TRAP-type C4-dicarboxylate transport system permease small subunit